MEIDKGAAPAGSENKKEQLEVDFRRLDRDQKTTVTTIETITRVQIDK
jgi:hypothetical protein